MKNYKLVECLDLLEWDKFIKSSPQNNIFSHSWFLKERKREYKFYFILKEQKIISAAIVSLDKNKRPIDTPWVHHGIYLNDDFKTLKNHKFTKNYIDLILFLIDSLSKKMNLISFNLHPSIQDMRPFQWSVFENKTNLSLSIKINSTAILNINSYKNFEEYLMCIRKVRRQEYNKCIKLGFRLESSKDLAILDKLHDETFQRQGLKRNDHDKLLCNEIAEKALANNSGELILCRDTNGRYVAGALFLYDEQCSYYLIGATEESERKNSPMTYIILEQIKKYFHNKRMKFDFCGINSPNRGDYKTSFNADIYNYFTPTIKINN